MKKRIIIAMATVLLALAITAGYNTQTKATTDLGKPKAVKAYNPKPDVIYLKWDKVSGADGYYVYYSTKSNSGFRIINVEKKNSVVISGLKGRTKYYFRVKSYNSIGVVSENSETVSARSSTFGIDVSKHQGEIDWARVKPQIDFAILRVGYGNDMPSQDDERWFYNANECTRLNIPFGAYIYSYATNVSEALSEASHAKRLLSPYKLKYPVYYDMEDAPTTGLLSAQAKGDLAQNFCDSVKAAGYKVGIYANKYWFENYLTDPRFAAWEKWVAQYNTQCTYNGTYKMWQYSSDGYIDGINGRVDVNYKVSGTNYDLSDKVWRDINTQSIQLSAPQDLTIEVTSSTSTHVKWGSVPGATRYIVYRKRAEDKKYARVAVTIGTELFDSNLQSGDSYIYKVCAYTGDAHIAYFSQFSTAKRVELYISTPENLKTKQASKKSIRITWNRVSAATSYYIYRYDSSKKMYIKIGTSRTNSYTDARDIKSGVVYKYRLKAVKKTSTGIIYSNAAAVNGIAGPAKVSGFTADNFTKNVIKLRWKKATGANRYQIYYATSKNGKYRLIYNVSSNKVSYDVRNLKSGKKYYFKMRAVRINGGITLKSGYTEAIGKVVK